MPGLDPLSSESTPAPRAEGLRGAMEAERSALLRFLAARCGDADLAQDLYQELWLRIGEARTGPIANPRGYLWRAANNLVLDYRRGAMRQRLRDGRWLDAPPMALAEADPAPAADEELALAQEVTLLRRAIAALPAGARRALTLHRIDELTHAEVAAEMGISRSGVEKHMAVAMRHLRRALLGEE